MAMAWMVSSEHPLRGLCGGDDAGPYSNHFEVGTERERKIELSTQAQLPANAVIAYQHGGGAGFGRALLRDPEAVKEDGLDERVSLAAARAKYGVVLGGTLEEYHLGVEVPRPKAHRQKKKTKPKPD